MHYLIDGYNVLHHVGRLQAGRGNLEQARLDLLRRLQQRFGPGTDHVTVVFDARKDPPPAGKDRQDYHGIEVRFTRSEEADDFIETLIRAMTAPPQLTVVSNDRRLKESARRRRCPVVECVAFWESLGEKPRANTVPPPEMERPPVGSAEVEHWVREFGDLDADAGFKELFDDYGDMDSGAT